jgi:uncharacterized protein YbaP (TraB family)
MVRTLRLALAVVIIGLSGAGVAAASPPVWVVKSKTTTIVLFGSVHLLPPGLKWQPRKLSRALGKANEVWFEIPIDAAANLAATEAALKVGIQPPGQTLSAQLTPDDQAHLARAAAACGLPVAGLDRLMPWYADVTLSVASYRLAGAMLDDGVERQFAAQVPPTVPQHAFETPQEQIGYLASASADDQVASLRETLNELDEGPASYERLVAAWMSGDAKAILREAVAPMMVQAPGVYKSLVVDRNQRWVDVIDRRLKGDGEVVMVVGVGHLVGPQSLPALLRARGYKVEGP